MLALEVIRTAGWLVGTILHGVLLAVLIEGRRKRGTARAYSWLVGSAMLWHLGNLLVAFLGELSGNRLPTFLLGATILATVGFGLLPSALIHTAVVARKDLFKRPRLVAVLGYVPALALIPVVYWMIVLERDSFLHAFRNSPLSLSLVGAWFVAALGVAARTISAPARTPEAEREHLKFRRSFGVGLFTLAIALVLTVTMEIVTGGGRGMIGETFRLFGMFMSLLPGGLFFYHVYRYRYLDLTLRRGLSFAALLIAVFLAHALVIRRITTALEKAYGVDFAMLEGVLVVGVVLAFEPARRRVQSAIDAALAPDRNKRRARLAAVQGEVATLPPGDLRPVVARARQGLEQAYQTRAMVALRVAWSVASSEEEDESDDVSCDPQTESKDIAPLLSWAAGDTAVANRPVTRDSLPPGSALAAERLGLSDLIAIRSGAETVQGVDIEPTIGFIGLGPRRKGQDLGEEDLSFLEAIAQTLGAAARDADVVRRMVSLEHKLAEAEKLSSLGRLSATIAHEVKNPLSSIKTIVGVLRESGLRDRGAANDLEVIATEVDRLSKVVTNLLNVARPAKKPGEGTSIAPSPQGFDAQEMLEGLLAVLGPDARRRGLRIETKFAPGTPRVWARESAIRQAIFQLILNAIEITPEGGVVSVSAAALRDSKVIRKNGLARGEVEIVVEDTGPGIAPDRADRIFEPFVSMKRGGTGLGLSLARDEITRADGRIEAGERRDGKSGARFRVVLPAAVRTAPT